MQVQGVVCYLFCFQVFESCLSLLLLPLHLPHFIFIRKTAVAFLDIVPLSTYVFDMDQDFLVSVLDVHKDNLQFIWPSLVCSIQNSSFISLDCVNE